MGYRTVPVPKDAAHGSGSGTVTRPPSLVDAEERPKEPVPEIKKATRRPLPTTAPPDMGMHALDVPLVLPERVFFERLDDIARRLEMVTALMQANGLSRAQGSRAIQAALASVAVSAEEAQVSSLGSLARALGYAVGELVANAAVPSRQVLDILVLDESEISRDFTTIAAEAQGHTVRCAKDHDEFIALLNERLPDVIVTEVALTNTPPRHFCAVLADILQSRPIRLVLFSALPETELGELRHLANATAAISKDRGLPALISELSRWVE